MLQLPEQYRPMSQMPPKKKHKHKKHKKDGGKEGPLQENQGQCGGQSHLYLYRYLWTLRKALIVQG